MPLHGPHQAGILTAPPPAACFAAFDVVAERRRDAARAAARADRASQRFLTSGGIPPQLGTGAPPSDSGTLGPEIAADGLTDHRRRRRDAVRRAATGSAPHRPRHLTGMRSFPNDDLDPAQTGGDLLLQICAGSPDTAIHALR